MKTHRYLFALVAFALLGACIKPSTPTPITDPEEDLTPAKTVNDLKITEFGISPEHNDAIYCDVSFIENNQINGIREIKYYKTDLTALKTTFKTNATKVTIGTTEQTSGVTANDLTATRTYRFYALDGNYKEYQVRLSNPEASYSGLPLVVLTINDGTDITSKEIWKSGRFVVSKQLQTGEGAADYAGDAEFKGRGNSTWREIKKPYAIKLAAKNSVLGMNKHKRWVLLANYGDKTGLRNRVAFEMSKRLFDNGTTGWTPDSRFVEVVLNGQYLGQYLLTEHIRVDENRVNIKEVDNTVTSGDDLTGGYLIEVDHYYDTDPWQFRPTLSDLPVMISAPDPPSTQQLQWITDHFNQVEATIYKDDPDMDEYGQYIDVDSYIKVWIVLEISNVADALTPGSIYMYKDVNKKLFAGPVWDFGANTFKGGTKFLLVDYNPGKSGNNRGLWYGQLFKDPKFKARAKTLWNQYYPQMQSIPDFMDAELAYILKSAEINWTVWPLKIPSGNTTGATATRNFP